VEPGQLLLLLLLLQLRLHCYQQTQQLRQLGARRCSFGKMHPRQVSQ
jgi:hypothetical protein